MIARSTSQKAGRERQPARDRLRADRGNHVDDGVKFRPVARTVVRPQIPAVVTVFRNFDSARSPDYSHNQTVSSRYAT